MTNLTTTKNPAFFQCDFIELYHIGIGTFITDNYQRKHCYVILNNFGFDAIGEGFTNLKQAQKVCKELNTKAIQEFKNKYHLLIDDDHTRALIEGAIFEYVAIVHNNSRCIDINYLIRYTTGKKLMIIEAQYLGPQKSDCLNDLILILTPLCEGLNIVYNNHLNQYEISFKANKYNYLSALTSYFGK